MKRYTCRCREASAIEAAMNGHLDLWPECDAEEKENWFVFRKDGKRVFSCNPQYARANFELEEKK